MNTFPQAVNGNGATRAEKNNIAIIGMSGRYPGGANTPELLWKTLRSGTDAVSEAQGDRWDLGWHHPDKQRNGRVYTRAGGFLDRIDGFDAEFFGLSPREVRQIDPQQRLLLELAWEALEDAGIAPRSKAGSATGVFIGISSNDYASLDGSGWADAYSNTGSAFSIAANRISYIFDFHGPSIAMDTACSSSLVCVHQACASLMAGECSTALAGGVSILAHIRLWQGFAKASMLSPTGRCKSFDATGDGYVRSEGGGLVLLKPLAAAERDGDRILGVILASGVNSDGRTVGLSMPNGDAQEKLIRTVFSQCSVKPEDVFYVEAHGTGTAVGDPIECGALGRVFGESRVDGSCLIGSVKSNIGHLEPASGIAGLTKVLLALKHREIPANLHFTTPNPQIDFEKWKLEVVTKATPFPDEPVVVGVNSFGFGGTNAHAAIQEYRPKPKRRISQHGGKPSNTENTLILFANTADALQAVADSYVEYLQSTESAPWNEVCAAAAICRSPLRHRLALNATSKEQAIEKLKDYLGGKPVAGLAVGSSATPLSPIAFVYSGNGPQWWGMGRELLSENAIFRSEIEAIDAIFAPLAGWSLIHEMGRTEAESRISLTEIAQPLLFAQQVGLTQILTSAGIRPSFVLGHSVGEVAAAYASGALTREQATRVIFHRSREQAKTAGRGKMAALGISADEARQAINAATGWLELAAVNSPQSVTVAGGPQELDALTQQMIAAGKFARVLPLNYPFHTKAMEPIRDGLMEDLSGLAPVACRVPFISTVDGTDKPGVELDAEYWYRNVREPVRFHDAVSHLLTKHGATVFLEIGPHPVLKDYVLQSAKALDLGVAALQTLRRPGSKGPEPESANLSTAIAACHAHGGSDLEQLFTRPDPPPALPLYPWQRLRFWRGSVVLPDVFTPMERDHPLLGHRVPSMDGLWENPVDLNLLPYLKDHVVQNAVLFPGAGYIDLCLEAGQSALGQGTFDLESFEILRPLTIPAHGDPILQTSFNIKDGEVEIRSRTDRDSTEWVRHVRARLSRTDPSPKPGETRDLAEITSRLLSNVSGEGHYLESSKRGLDYGPTFRGVKNILLTAPNAAIHEALAEIHLPFLETEGAAEYLAHPSLLDSCLQVMITLLAQNEARNCSIIPVQMGRVRSIAPLTSRIFCRVVIRSESERSAVADFEVMDQEGNLLLTLDEARCQKVDFGQSAAAPLTSEWWRPDIATPALENPSSLPNPIEIFHAMTAEVAAVAKENDRPAFYADIRPQLEKLVGAYAVRAIRALGATDGEFTLSNLARKGGVKRDKTGLLAKLAKYAEQDGHLISAGSTWHWNKDRVAENPETIWRRLFETYPGYYAELLLLAEAGGNLSSELRGREGRDPSTTLLDQLFDTSPFQKTYNEITRAVIGKLVANWPDDRPIRILEIAGAAGGLAMWILPVLPPERTDYLFTDSSESSIGRAEHRLAAHRFVRFATLDLTRDLVEQDQPAGYFDLVIGTNLLASIDDPEQLIERLKTVMAPSGLLLAVQANSDRFTDLVLSAGASSLGAELAAAGFEVPVEFHEAVASPQQAVLLARLESQSTIQPVQQHARPVEYIGMVPRRVMVVFENDEALGTFGRDLVTELSASGLKVVVQSFPAAEADLKAAISLALEQHVLDEIVYIPGTGDDLRAFLETQKRRSLIAAYLVQGLEAVRHGNACRLSFVTRGAFPAANGHASVDTVLQPEQATLWGLGRVIANEHTALNLRLIDLHRFKCGASDASLLASELLRRDAETEVQLSDGCRFVNRERLNNLTDEARLTSYSKPVAAAAFALDFKPHGGLDSLHLRSAERKAPKGNEVEIGVMAAGLNFRDILWTMGMLPEEAVEKGFSGPAIGMECAGEIIRVGDAVTSLKAGDRVVAFASNCFGSHVTTDSGAVAMIPDSLDFAAAATIPTAFLTAFYAFDYLARLEPGETVLIHGAAGGVGMAAIQIAKLKGAKVIGTAGSARKRRMLELLGVDHVLNSRSLEFADEVMRITGGTGVDVVLNSLAGEAITRSLNCLRPFGRFLEIGKRDLYANSHIGLRPFRNNLSYFGIDADTLLVERPVLAHSMFKTIIGHFATGALRPLPFQAIPVSRAAEAFRSMQQSRHVGKLVVTMGADRPSSLAIVPAGSAVRPDVTYLVTGGLSGFGLATAEWLAEQGATSLALVGRRGANTEEAAAGIARMEKMGASVRSFAADISDPAALSSVLSTVRSHMAALKGVIHSAAVIEDASILNIGADQLERVFRPKLLGAWNLHQATLQDELEMFVLYSSSSAVVGNPGQGAYVAANLYLDALALHRRSLGLAALSIGWGAIKDAGFLTRHQAVAGMLKNRTGLDATPARDALADLGRLSVIGATRVSVGRFDLQKLSQLLPAARSSRFIPIIPKGAAANLQTEETLVDILKKIPETDWRPLILARVREHGARVLGTSAAQVSIDQPLADLGLDSLMAVELAGGLERDLGRPISVMQMLSAGSLSSIAELVMKMLGGTGSDESRPSIVGSAEKKRVMQETRA